VTPEEWSTSTDPQKMLSFLRERGASDRKLRLFAVACCRTVEHLMRRRASRAAVGAAERYADGLAGEPEVVRAWQAVTMFKLPIPGDLIRGLFEPRAAGAAASWSVARPAYPERAVEQVLRSQPAGERGVAAERYCAFLRDVVGPLAFRLGYFKAKWRTDTTIALARQMYESRDFGAMPILADALQDAGCEVEDIVNHCRGSGPHVRGCWVVDLALGKT
jgi:hypothetical protein